MREERNQGRHPARTVCGQPGWYVPQRAQMIPVSIRPTPSAPRRPAITVCVAWQQDPEQLRGWVSALRQQTLADSQWELLVMDMGSDKESRERAVQLIAAEFPARGRLVTVSLPGQAWVRSRAAWEARGEIVCFLETNLRPAPDFLTEMLKAFTTHAAAGILGGNVLLSWEEPPSPLAEVVAPVALGIHDLGNKSRCLDLAQASLPPGGLFVRRQVLLNALATAAPPLTPAGQALQDRGNPVDQVIGAAAQQLGWECWYVPTLQLYQVVKREQLNKAGLLRRFEQIGRNQGVHRPAWLGKLPAPAGWLGGLKDFCCWQFRQWRGPAPHLRDQHPTLAADLHELEQELLRARACQALTGGV